MWPYVAKSVRFGVFLTKIEAAIDLGQSTTSTTLIQPAAHLLNSCK